VPGRSVLFELTILGAFARMAAVDEATGLEVVVTGPANAARSDLEALALRKLERQMKAETPQAPKKRGKLV
jgi:hypothetical protein